MTMRTVEFRLERARKTAEQDALLDGRRAPPAEQGRWLWQATANTKCRVSAERAHRLAAAGERVWLAKPGEREPMP